MKILKYFIVIFFMINFNSLNAENENLQNKITKNLRCLICQGQSVYDSQSDFAVSIKILIKNKLQEGKKEDEIYNYLKKLYGEWIVYEPEFNT